MSDIIQEEFEKWVISGCTQDALNFAKNHCNNWIPETKPISFHDGYRRGRKSSDEEIKKLRDALDKCNRFSKVMLKNKQYNYIQDIANISYHALKEELLK